MFAPIAHQNRPEIDLFSFQAARLPPALPYFMFPFIENIGFVVSRGTQPLFAERRFAWMHVAAAFFLSSRAPSLKSMQIFHEALSIALAHPPPAGVEKKNSSPGQPLFPPPPRRPLVEPFFHSVDAARRGGT